MLRKMDLLLCFLIRLTHDYTCICMTVYVLFPQLRSNVHLLALMWRALDLDSGDVSVKLAVL